MQRRRPTRIRGYDYATANAYFVTICASRRGDVFGEVAGGSVRLNALGRCARACLDGIDSHHSATVDTSIVMPDHVHAVVVLGLRSQGVPLQTVIGQFKAAVSRTSGRPGLWQRGYHDHIVRGDEDLERVRDYIVSNPARWTERHGR